MKARIETAAAALGQAARSWTPDVLMIAGAALIAFGAWLIYPPVGFIAGGVLTLAGGVLAARRA